MKICPVGAELFHANGRTDRETDRRDEANRCFSQFCERAYKVKSITIYVIKQEQSAISHRAIRNIGTSFCKNRYIHIFTLTMEPEFFYYFDNYLQN